MTNYTEIGMLVTLCGATLGSIIFTIQRSKCTKIKCCGTECERDVSNVDEELPDLEAPPVPIQNLTPVLSRSNNVATLRQSFEGGRRTS